MTIAERALARQSTAEHHRRERPDHPDGWTPGLADFGVEGGVITSPPVDSSPDWDALIAHYLPAGWDPTAFAIDPDSVRFTGWDGWKRDTQGEQATSAVLHSFRARIIPRRMATAVDPDLASWIRKARPRRPEPGDGDRALVVVWADWQVGKPDGDGTLGTASRVVDMIGKVQDQWRKLRRAGVPLEALYVLPAGDLGEACSGHYAQQAFRVELNERQQTEVIRNLASKALKEWASLAPRIVVAPVGGNHGEVRQDGASFTDFGDNRDVAVFETVAWALAENPDAFGHISFQIPNAELTQTLDVFGSVVGVAHGHQARKGSTPEQKLLNWWRGQMEGRQAIGDADILVSGHYHHLQVVRQGTRTWMQAPALDGGSEWFENMTGLASPPGTLSFVAGGGEWDHLRVL